MATSEIVFRLGVAALIGGMLGLNRDLHHKPTGLRTLSLVAIGAALTTIAVDQGTSDPGAASRVLQGLITGIGFLGAGVIVREASDSKVRGLTTAATIWATALLGAVCGLGHWAPVITASALIAAVLTFGGRIEKAIHRAFDAKSAGTTGNPDAT